MAENEQLENAAENAGQASESAAPADQGAGQNPGYERQKQRIKSHRARDKQNRTMQVVQILAGTAIIGFGGLFLIQHGADLFHSNQSNYQYQAPDIYEPDTTNVDNQPTFIKMPNLGSTEMWKQMGALLDPLAKISAVGGVGLFLYARSTRRKYLEFDKIGLLISDSSKRGEGNARFIPWGCLEGVEVFYGKNKAPKPNTETLNQLAGEIVGDAANCQIAFYVDDQSIVKISWRDLVSCCEPGSFINALKTWAPDAAENVQFPGEVGKIGTSSYTQLWFKYYSTSSERKRLGHLAQGDQLQEGRFTVAGQLGGGGQGTAYLAVDGQAGENQPTEVVLKEYILPVHRGEVVLEQTIEKLRREANILREIDHNNIVKMMGEFIEDHRGYLIMEYVQGRSLKALVTQQGTLPEKTVRELALQMCEVLGYLHGLTPPVIHRDMTPDNLILQDDGVVKLVDFNVAHQLESQATATVVGKHCYIPPEQFRGKPTEQSDVYAFGCTLHYMLTGLDPEPLTVSRPREFNEQVSEEMNELVARCTMLDHTKRFSNIHQVREALEQLENPDKGATIKLNEKKVSA